MILPKSLNNFQFLLFCFLIFLSFASSADDDEDGKS